MRISSRNVALQTIFSLYSKFFLKFWEYAKDVYVWFVHLDKAYHLILREKLWGVLKEYDVDDRLLLAVKWLCSCSEVCVRVGGVKSQPFIVSVGLRKGLCVHQFSPRSMNWMDSYNRVDVGVNTGICKIITHRRGPVELGASGPCPPILRQSSHFVLWEALSQTK